jgi:hypothetical protein
MTGRYLSATADFRALAAQAEAIVRDDAQVLRLTTIKT